MNNSSSCVAVCVDSATMYAYTYRAYQASPVKVSCVDGGVVDGYREPVCSTSTVSGRRMFYTVDGSVQS